MSEALFQHVQRKSGLHATPSFTPVRSGLLQRKCACGGTPGPTGECEASKKKRLGLQTKLAINQPGDIYEQEADRIADQVMAAPSHSRVSGVGPGIQRFSGHSGGQMDAAPPSVDRVLASPGRPLEPALRQDMGQRFDHDFARVRVHADAAAEQSARDVNAHAYTVGHDIVFGADRFAPGTRDGRRLIAHELTHVVQQSGMDGMNVSQSNDKCGLSSIAPGLQRQPAIIGKDSFHEKAAPDIDKAIAASFITMYVPQKDLKTLAGNVEVLIPTDYEDAYKRWGGSKKDSIDIPGYTDRTAKKRPIKLRTMGRDNEGRSVRPSTVEAAVHETVHLNSQLQFKSNFLQNYNEGVTQHFTEKILGGAGAAYRDEIKLATGLIHALGSSGEDLVAKAYFKGDKEPYATIKRGFMQDPNHRHLHEWQVAAEKDPPDAETANRLLTGFLKFANNPTTTPPSAPPPAPAQSPSPPAVQKKLTINQPGDIYEQEADQIADQVTATPAHHVVSSALSRIQRFAGRPVRQAEVAPASVDRALANRGRPLELALRQDMEQRFGYDFSRVRVHSDAAAEQSAQDVNAQAYTVGHNVVFGAGRFAPGTHEGRRLIAHELAHVTQQSGRPGFAAGRDTGEMLARQPTTTHAKTGVDPNISLARELSNKLDHRERDAVLKRIKGLAEKDRDALDALEMAATQALDKPHGDDLRRIIRFVRQKPPGGVTPATFTVENEGKLESKAGAEFGAGKKVEVHTRASVKSSAGDEAYSLTYKGADAAEMHWLQFIWREVVAEFPPKAKGGDPTKEPLEKKGFEHGGRRYDFTTNPDRPFWTTDAGSKISPFYEDNTDVKRSSDSLTMVDTPDSRDDLVKDMFKKKAASPPKPVVSRFHAHTYLIKNMDVLYRAEIKVEWVFANATAPPVMNVTAKGGRADHIEAVQRARLASQDPDVDYLPGPATDPLGEFDVIDDQSQAQWANPKAADLDKYKDIIAVTRAGWINDVSGIKPSNNINVVTASKMDVKPGLNYLQHLKKGGAGETGYIDAKDKDTSPDLPIDADTDPLPRVAIILTEDAFNRDKDWALESLRHELRHAANAQLAIGWLLTWREKKTGKPFKDWIRAQRKANQITEANYALVTTGLNLTAGSDVDLAPTEVLAYTEGIITALPFLPPKPKLALIAGDKYPASIRGLMEGSPRYDAATAYPVRKIALQLIHDSCCALGKKDAMVAWINFLIDPASMKPTSKGDKQTVDDVTNEFSSKKFTKKFIKEVLASVNKPCPPVSIK